MNTFDWSVIDSQSFAMGMCWFVCCHLLLTFGNRLLISALEALDRLTKKRREHKVAKKEDVENVH